MPPQKISCPETEPGGFCQLADYPTLVFKLTLVNVYGLCLGGGGGGGEKLAFGRDFPGSPPSPPLYETLWGISYK